ncbi:MAG: 4Fe-4S dicluster domain-containing protein [Bacillota bacterium]
MKVLSVASNRCVGCRLCEQWCSYSHHGTVSPAGARIRILRDLDGERDVPLVCRQCAVPLCTRACPAGALTRDEKTGAVRVDYNACAGCGVCVEACPHGAVGVDRKGYPIICDLCGGCPQCAVHCPEGAIRYLRRELVDRDIKHSAVRRMGGDR